MVKGKLSTIEIFDQPTRSCGAARRMLTGFNPRPPTLSGRERRIRAAFQSGLHEVDACMMPQNALRPLSNEPTGVVPAPGRSLAHAAEALISNPVTASGSVPPGVALIIARDSTSLPPRARRNFNVHAHADRCAPPGGNPGRGRQGKPDRGI